MGLSFYVYNKYKDDYGAMISGGMAGLLNWTVTLPIDCVKSRQIVNNITILEALQMGNLYVGFKYVFLRSILVNAAIYSTYDFCNSLWK